VKLRGAISGFGQVAAMGHLPGWRSRPEVQIVAVHEPVAERRHEALRMIEGVRVYEDLDLMLTGERLDFVDIASPPAYHAASVTSGLRAGVHVLVEKPLCLTIEDFDRLEALARSKNRILFCAHNWKYASPYVTARRLIGEDKLGHLTYASIIRMRAQQAGGAIWRLDPKLGGGGILVDHGWHAFYLLHWIFGGSLPLSLSARFSAAPHSRVEESADVAIIFPHGAIGYCHLSWRAPFRRTSTLIYGDRGAIEIEADRLIFTARNESPIDLSIPDPPDDSYHAAWFSRLAARFESAIEDGMDSQTSRENLLEARTALHLTLAGQESAKSSGQLVTVALQKDPPCSQ
jgi:predicted dehydrogenase